MFGPFDFLYESLLCLKSVSGIKGNVRTMVELISKSSFDSVLL